MLYYWKVLNIKKFYFHFVAYIYKYCDKAMGENGKIRW